MRTSGKILSLALVSALIAVSAVPAHATSSEPATTMEQSGMDTKAEAGKTVKKAAGHHHMKKHMKAHHAAKKASEGEAKEGTAYESKTNQ